VKEIQRAASRYFNQRPAGVGIDTIVIHSMYAPAAPDPFSALTCKETLDTAEVSAHYLIDREGFIYQLVSDEQRAWHAGVSVMPGTADTRSGVNDFSIGIELVGSDTSGFTDLQYQALTELTKDLADRFPIRTVVGHSDIAPDRKTDPWNFDWLRYQKLLDSVSIAVTIVRR
jgi:AmpD protein